MKYICRMKVKFETVYANGIEVKFKFIPEGKFFAKYVHTFSMNFNPNWYEDTTKFKIRYMELQEILTNTEAYALKKLSAEIASHNTHNAVSDDYLEIQVKLSKLAKNKFELEV